MTLGADPNATNCTGDIPLATAVKHFHSDMVSLLLESGSDVNHRNASRMTPLHFCFDRYHDTQHSPVPRLVHGWTRCATLLIEAGADMNAACCDHQSPLVVSIRKGNRQAAEFLLLQNCDPDFPASSVIAETVEGGERRVRAEVMSPFLTSIFVKDLSLLRSLLLAGCRCEDYSCVCAQPEFQARVREMVSKPRNLMETCRAVLRRKLRECGGVGSRLNKKVEKLVLPTTLKDFILMKDLKAQPCSVT